jgi:hypothetical protein
MSELTNQIMNHIRTHGACSARQIADAILGKHKHPRPIHNACSGLEKRGLLVSAKVNGSKLYSLSGKELDPRKAIKKVPKGTRQMKKQKLSDVRNGLTITLDELKSRLAGKRVMYIIPCCSRKNSNGNIVVAPAGQVPGLIGPDLVANLYVARADAYAQLAVPHVVNQYGSEFGANEPEKANYLHAYDRYNGHLYSVNNVHALLQNPSKDINIVIMSALYGLVTPSDLIQDYDLVMSKTRKIWAKVLPSIIEEYANAMNIDIVVGLFGRTTAYNAVFNRLGRIQNHHRPVFSVHTIRDGHNQNGISEGLGHVLLYLASGVQPPEEFHYTVNQVRP